MRLEARTIALEVKQLHRILAYPPHAISPDEAHLQRNRLFIRRFFDDPVLPQTVEKRCTNGKKVRITRVFRLLHRQYLYGLECCVEEP